MSIDTLPQRLARQKQRRRRSEAIAAGFLKSHPPQVIDRCNICNCEQITTITSRDRYGAPVRAAQCDYCGLVFLVDRPSAADYGEFYKSVYRPLVSAYNGRLVNAQSMRGEQTLYGENLMNVLRGAGGIRKGSTILDVGGSTGEVATVFARELGGKATVLDPSPDELEVARSLGHETILGLLESWDPPAGLQFDLVLCCRTIDHFLDLGGSLRKLRGLLAPGGRLVIDVVDFGYIWASRGPVEAAIKVDHCYYLSSENSPHILRAAGLEVVFSEIASYPERITHVCRATEPAPMPDLSEWARDRVRAIQLSRYAEREAAAKPVGAVDWAHRKLFGYKKAILRSLNGRK